METTGLQKQIENEIRDYFDNVVSISPDYDFSQAKLVRRISLFENHVYPTGKFDSAGNYKFWFDIITPRIDSEVKNIDFDTKNIEVYSERKIDELPNLIVNLKLKEYLKNNGQAEEINSSIEEGSGWGNFLQKKVNGTYERCDLKNTYIINQTAQTVNDTAIIERHQLSQSDLRTKEGIWKNINEVIKECKQNTYSTTAETTATETTTPYYEIYERNGEVCLKDLKEYLGEKVSEGDENIFVLARVIGVGTKGTNNSGVKIKYIMFAKEMKGKMSDIYKEYHRSRYKGRWFREGLIELLFDIQVRANQIGNQIAQGLEYASKTIFYSPDKLIFQNILSDLKNGDLIRTQQISQVPVRMEGLDQLIADWNRLIALANDIANSREVVQGITPASGTPLGTTQMLNTNANKLFDFIREKLAIPFTEIFEEWIIPNLVKELKAKEIIRLTGDSDMLDRVIQVVVDSWYLNNLINLPPHTKEIADTLKQQKFEELKKRPQLLMTGIEEMFNGYKASVTVNITGENLDLGDRIQTFMTLAQTESDPVRRQAIIEKIAKLKGIDFGALPKSEPNKMQPINPIINQKVANQQLQQQ